MAIPVEASESVNPSTSLWTKVICHCCHLITIPTYLEQGRPIINVTVTSSDRRGSRALCEGRAVGMLCNSQKTSWPNKHRRAQRVSQRWHFALSLPCRELHKQFLVTFLAFLSVTKNLTPIPTACLQRTSFSDQNWQVFVLLSESVLGPTGNPSHDCYSAQSQQKLILGL